MTLKALVVGTPTTDGPCTVHLRLPLEPADEKRELGER